TAFYVTSAGGACTFTTITAAIAAAVQSSAATRTIHVAPGTYGTGETFPLDLRGGISLVGDGAHPTDTIIVGAAGLPHGVAGGSVGINPIVTLAVGDVARESRVENVRILSGGDAHDAVGILCDRGTGGTASPPNLIVDNVRIEPGYAADIQVGDSAVP